MFQHSLRSSAEAAGAVGEIPDALNAVILSMRDEFRAFAVESWIHRFPGFVADLEGRLGSYTRFVRAAEEGAVADAAGAEVGPRVPLWGLLTTLRVANASGQLADDDYEWLRDRARMALNELDADPDPQPLAPTPSPVPSSPSPAGSTSSSAASSVKSSAPGGSRPQPRIVLPAAAGGSAAPVAPVVAAAPVCRLLIGFLGLPDLSSLLPSGLAV